MADENTSVPEGSLDRTAPAQAIEQGEMIAAADEALAAKAGTGAHHLYHNHTNMTVDSTLLGGAASVQKIMEIFARIHEDGVAARVDAQAEKDGMSPEKARQPGNRSTVTADGGLEVIESGLSPEQRYWNGSPSEPNIGERNYQRATKIREHLNSGGVLTGDLDEPGGQGDLAAMLADAGGDTPFAQMRLVSDAECYEKSDGVLAWSGDVYLTTNLKGMSPDTARAFRELVVSADQANGTKIRVRGDDGNIVTLDEVLENWPADFKDRPNIAFQSPLLKKLPLPAPHVENVVQLQVGKNGPGSVRMFKSRADRDGNRQVNWMDPVNRTYYGFQADECARAVAARDSANRENSAAALTTPYVSTHLDTPWVQAYFRQRAIDLGFIAEGTEPTSKDLRDAVSSAHRVDRDGKAKKAKPLPDLEALYQLGQDGKFAELGQHFKFSGMAKSQSPEEVGMTVFKGMRSSLANHSCGRVKGARMTMSRANLQRLVSDLGAYDNKRQQAAIEKGLNPPKHDWEKPATFRADGRTIVINCEGAGHLTGGDKSEIVAHMLFKEGFVSKIRDGEEGASADAFKFLKARDDKFAAEYKTDEKGNVRRLSPAESSTRFIAGTPATAAGGLFSSAAIVPPDNAAQLADACKLYRQRYNEWKAEYYGPGGSRGRGRGDG